MPNGRDDFDPLAMWRAGDLDFPPDIDAMLRELEALEPQWLHKIFYNEGVEWELRFKRWFTGEITEQDRDALRKMIARWSG